MKLRHLVILPIAVLLVLIIAAIIIIATVDLNQQKPQLEELAKTHAQLDLNIEGDLSWRFWPSIGVNVGKTDAYLLSSPQEKPLAAVNHFALDVSVLPLFVGKLDIKGLELEGLTLNLAKDKNGVGNWTHIGPSNSAKPENTADDADNHAIDHGQTMRLSLDALLIDDASINYKDAQTQTEQNLIVHSLKGSDINTDGKPFNINFDVAVTQDIIQTDTQKEATNKNTLTIENRSQANISFDRKKQMLHINKAESKLSANVPDIAETLRFNIVNSLSYNLNSGEATIDTFEIRNNNTDITFSGKAKLPQNATEKLAADGLLSASVSNLKKQLRQLGITIEEPSNKDVLNSLSVNTQVLLDGDTTSLKQLKAKLDNTELNGELALQSNDTPKVSGKLWFTDINIDHYLPAPPQEASADQSNQRTSQTAATGDEPFSLDSIQSIDSHLEISFDSLIANKLLFEQLSFVLSTKRGVLDLKALEASFYDGKLQLALWVNSKTNPAKFEARPVLNAVQLEPMLKALDMDLGFSGLANINTDIIMAGNTVTALKRSISGTTKIGVLQGNYSKSNLEHLICKGIALARNKTLGNNWGTSTAFTNIRSDIQWLNGEGTITTFTSGLENAKLDATGKIRLPSSSYDIRLGANISGDMQEKDPACQINERYRDISWPLHCHSDGKNSSCGLDEKALKRTLTDVAKEKARAKVEDKIKEKLGDDLNETLKEGLRGLFK